jgi:hypothetical protein
MSWHRINCAALCLCVATASTGHAADQPAPDADLLAFSTYVSDVSRLDGMFHGVLDYCEQYVPAPILEQAKAAWATNNGQYIDSVDTAIRQFITSRVEAERLDAALAAMSANAKSWFQKAHDQSKVLDQVKAAPNKSIACSSILGTMASYSFELKRMIPADHDYWEQHLKQ